MLAASLLAEGPCRLRGVPRLQDIYTILDLLEGFGVRHEWKGGRELLLDPSDAHTGTAPYDLVRTMRASVMVLGPLVTRFGHARVSLPGGCAIGARPIDQHIKGLEAMGAGIRLDEPRAIDRFLEDFDRRLGLRRLVLVHFNDSKSEPGSRRDRHEHLGGGRIGERGLGHLIRHPSLRHAAFVLETPGMDEGYDLVNVARARDLLAGRRLEPLPAGPAAHRPGRSPPPR